jgi:hypothetical protein
VCARAPSVVAIPPIGVRRAARPRPVAAYTHDTARRRRRSQRADVRVSSHGTITRMPNGSRRGARCQRQEHGKDELGG